jgi:hypothetical protein
MAQVVDRVRRIRIAQEPAGAFGTEISIGSFRDLPAREDSVKLMMPDPTESPMLLQQHLYGYPSKVLMPKLGSGIDFATNVSALTSRAGSATQAVSTLLPDSLVWSTAFGGDFAGTGTTIASTSTTTSLVVTSAAGLREGGAVALATGAGGALECRVIKTISSNTVTLKLALSSVPANASVVYAAYTVYMNALDGSQQTFLQAAVEGIGTTDRWLFKGGQLKSAPTLELQPATIPKLTTSWNFAGWYKADGTNTTMNLNSALADQNYTSDGINSVMDSEFRIWAHGSSVLTNTFVHAPSLSIAPQIKYGPHKTPGGFNTIKQWVMLRPDGPPVTGEFKLPYEDTTWIDLLEARTDLQLTFQVGSTVSHGAVLFDVPRMSLDDFGRDELDGLAGQTLKWYGRLDNQTTSSSTNLQKTAFRVHFF